MTTRTYPASPGRADCTIHTGQATTRGHRRPVNEDATGAGPTWFVVADGMGGHRAGDVASALAITALTHDMTDKETRSTVDVHERVASANAAIRSRARCQEYSGMGATVVGAVVVHDDDRPAIAVFHVGDSRCYRLASERLDQLTIDHSYVQDLIELGRIDAAQATTHPQRHVVTRALGLEASVDCEITTIEIRSCRLLLCSDGVSDQLEFETIERVMGGEVDPQQAADRLIELVLAGEAGDNATALVIDIEPPGFPSPG